MDFNIQKNKNTVFLNESLPFVQSGDVDWLLLEGSSRSAKTWGILLFLISLALDPQKVGRNRLTIRAFRQDATTTAVSIVADFVEIMDNLFSYEDSGKKYSLFYAAGVWNKTLKTYTFSNGSTFSFHGASDAQKIQGGKQDIAWLNECMEIMPDSDFWKEHFVVKSKLKSRGILTPGHFWKEHFVVKSKHCWKLVNDNKLFLERTFCCKVKTYGIISSNFF